VVLCFKIITVLF